jgi:hypothetical protein
MPRANRSTVPDYVWHIAHRRHKREFRLRAKADRAIWRRWLWRSTSRYGLGVLNFVASSNRIDLLVYDAFAGETIARSLQQVQGCTPHGHNRRRGRARCHVPTTNQPHGSFRLVRSVSAPLTGTTVAVRAPARDCARRCGWIAPGDSGKLAVNPLPARDRTGVAI